jgi:preprotein translocase subunit SecD
MLEYARWKYVLAALILVVATVYSLPNLHPQDSAVQIGAQRGKAVDAALQERVQGVLEAQGIPFKSIGKEKDNLLVRLVDPTTQLKASDAVRAELGDDYIVAQNLASTVPDWLDKLGAKGMALGLDLQGGVHFLMEVDERAALEKRELAFVEDIKGILREAELHYSAVNRGASSIVVQLRDGTDRDAAAGIIGRDIPGLEVENGAEPNTLVARVRETEIKTIIDNALEQNIGTLRKRINELGVAEPIVQRQGSNRIVVELPGVQDAALARKILGATATLEYRAQVDGNPVEAAQTGRAPPTARVYRMRDTGQPILLSKSIIASGDQLVDARAGFDPQDNSPQVTVTLNNAGGARMLDFTTESVGRMMGVVFVERTPVTRIVDGKEVRTAKVTEDVISYARINGVFGKTFSTTGLESPKEASELALLLRAGSLAAPIDIIEERIIGPSLGAENIEKGWKAVAYSFIFVLVFFVVYYRVFGLITNVALLLNLLLVVAVMSLIGATLTLPGLAGIALTVGMSVDANVLINERIREELRAGNTPLASIAAGYDKAAGTIADANITALLAGVALWAFGTGPVQGFAITLIFGILTSMYTAVSVSRGIATLIYGRRRKLASVSI